LARVTTRPIDQLYKDYSDHQFQDIPVTEDDPELYKFVQDVRKNGPVFGNYPAEKLEIFEERIYELRKNNLNNSTR
jgi:hypothetical protein